MFEKILFLVVLVLVPVLFMISYRIGPIRAFRLIQKIARAPNPVQDKAWADHAKRIAEKSDPYN